MEKFTFDAGIAAARLGLSVNESQQIDRVVPETANVTILAPSVLPRPLSRPCWSWEFRPDGTCPA